MEGRVVSIRKPSFSLTRICMVQHQLSACSGELVLVRKSRMPKKHWKQHNWGLLQKFLGLIEHGERVSNDFWAWPSGPGASHSCTPVGPDVAKQRAIVLPVSV